MSKRVHIVSTLLDGMIGFDRPLDAETFFSQLPSRERGLAEIIEIPIFDGPITASEYLRDKPRMVRTKVVSSAPPMTTLSGEVHDLPKQGRK